MTREQGVSPRADLRDPPVQQEKRRDAAQEQHGEDEDDEARRRDPEVGRVECVERHPRADVHEAAAVEQQVDHGEEYLVVRRGAEVPVPVDCGSCRDADG